MLSAIATTFRTLFVLTLLFMMPLLAMPQVLRRVDAILEPESIIDDNEHVSIGGPGALAGGAGPILSADSTSPRLSFAPVSEHGNDLRTVGSASPPSAAIETVALRQPALSSVPSSPGAQDEQFQVIQEQLRNLGARYMALMRTDDPGRPYRFYCEIGIADSPVYGQSFEARDENPLRAMQRVLLDAESWTAVATRSQPRLQSGETELR